MFDWLRRTPAPIIAPWAQLEAPVIQLGLLGKDRAIKEYVLLLPPEYPGQVVVHWQEVKRRKPSQQAFAVREESGPQCPHCTALQIFAALATAIAAPLDTMAASADAYNAILARGSTPGYTLTLQNDSWLLECRAQRGSAHTKYDCLEHKEQ